MNLWVHFPLYASVAFAFWTLALTCQFSPKLREKPVALILPSAAGVLAVTVFVVMLWVNLERPPMRTLGETRLWYSLFTPVIGIVIYRTLKHRWLLNYSLGMGALFLAINLLKPEAHSKALMPALQSVWFVPHVLVYIFAYAIFAASSAIAVRGLWKTYRTKGDKPSGSEATTSDNTVLDLANRLVYLGFGFLSLGLLFGALWAKEAWGHYWTWDPKETWALLTWLGYLAYIHVRYRHPTAIRAALWVLAFSFVILLICWFGVNYLPSASQSVHTYTQ